MAATNLYILENNNSAFSKKLETCSKIALRNVLKTERNKTDLFHPEVSSFNTVESPDAVMLRNSG